MKIRNIIQLVFLIGFIVFCVFQCKRQEESKKSLNANYRYVIGEVYDYSSNHRSSNYGVYYTFFLRGKKYASDIRVSKWTGKRLKDVNTSGGHYIVKVNPEDPNNNEMLIAIPVRRVPAVVSDTGWIDIPRWIIELNEKKYGDKK